MFGYVNRYGTVDHCHYFSNCHELMEYSDCVDFHLGAMVGEFCVIELCHWYAIVIAHINIDGLHDECASFIHRFHTISH